MAEPDGVDGRHKAGHDSGGRSINSARYKSLPIFLDKIRNMLYVFILTEFLPARRRPGPGEEKFTAV
jgi:hypothetical protein